MRRRVLLLRGAAVVALAICSLVVVVWVSPLRQFSWTVSADGRQDASSVYYLKGFHLPGPYEAQVGRGEIIILDARPTILAPGAPAGYPLVLRCSIWPLCVVPGVLGLVCLLLSFRRPPQGFCRQCSYDLTGNVSGICPECGTAISKGAPA